MIYKIFSVYDSKAQIYTNPFYQHNQQMAMRTFSDAINHPEHQFARNPEDYTLFEVGEFNDETGEVQDAILISLGNGLEFVRQPEEVGPQLIEQGN